MGSVLQFIVLLIVLFLIEWSYIRIAERYNFVNYRKPENRRLIGYKQTIRGGGIIFTIGVFISAYFFSFDDYYFLVGLAVIATVSFLDDVINIDFKIRLASQIIAVLLLFYQFDLFHLPISLLLIIGVFVIATINAYNFMDGINGITGGYSLLTIGTLYYINEKQVTFTSPELLIVVGLSLVVFNFFNFRKKAKCFAGDVGSVGMAFIIIFFIGKLILTTQNLSYILLLLVYGTDTAFTVLFRKIRGENIFVAHRSHFYQYLCNQLGYSHLLVSSLYIAAQLLLNVALISVLNDDMMNYSIYLFLAFVSIYLLLRFKLEGKQLLLMSYKY